MKNNNHFVGFDTLKRAVSITQVLEHYGLLEHLYRSGDGLSGACPLHNGHNKSQFRVSISKNCWICFGDCHVGGSIVDFVSRKEGVGIRDAAMLIQDWFGVVASEKPASQTNGYQAREQANGASRIQESGAPVVNPPLHFSLPHLNPNHPYFSERGLLPETITTFGLGYCERGTLTGWIAIPIHNPAAQLVAYAGRWPGEPPDDKPKYKLPKGFRKSLEVFNLHRAQAVNARQPLVVVEGFVGCMAVWQAGWHRVVSLMGSRLSEAQAALIIQAAVPAGKVILFFDEDEAGRKGCCEARASLARHLKVSVVQSGAEGTQPDCLAPEQLMQLLEQHSR